MFDFCRNKALKSSIKALKKKEAEDTKALEDIVQKVESNLVATTVGHFRAVSMYKALEYTDQ